MAAKADDPERIDRAFRSIAAVLDDLPAIAAEWETLSTDERLAWSLDWGNEIVKLRQMAEDAGAARLDASRYAEYRRLAERVTALSSIIERLKLRQPAEIVRASV
jgi:hypothetical protein